MKINKIKYVLLTSYLVLLTFLVSCSPPVSKPLGKPNIYLLQEDGYYGKFYMFENFQDNESDIKYIFDYAKKNKGNLFFLTNKNDIIFDDKVPFIKYDSKNHKFSFSRERNNEKNLNNLNFSIQLNYLKNTKINFQIKESQNEEKIPIKKLSADFDSLNVNIVQNFLDYSTYEDYKARKESENYIYELYNKNNKLKIRQIYHNFGKWFDIKIF